ncbi:hypothetical protein OH492_00495 [Vibrio chagasii]|nr:hypothetical protein [Vibrio chagasii]
MDNILAFHGVGRQTATALLQKLVSKLYQNLDDIAALGFRGSKTMAKLIDNKEQRFKCLTTGDGRLDY